MRFRCEFDPPVRHGGLVCSTLYVQAPDHATAHNEALEFYGVAPHTVVSCPECIGQLDEHGRWKVTP